MKNKKIYFGIAFLLGIFLLINSVSAFAVSSQYWRENPVIVYPGESSDITIDLQNMAGEDTIIATGVIIEGSEIASFSDPSNVYTLPPGTRLPINIHIDIPVDTDIPSNYSLILSFTTSTEEAEAVGLGSGVQKIIPLIVVKKPKEPVELKSSPWLYIILALIIILIVVITIVLKKRKKKK